MTISQATAFLETAYNELNKQYFDGALPKAIITIQSDNGAYGHFTTFDAWQDNKNAYKEINISAETLNRPMANTIGTLVHEMVHFYCHVNKIQDTSRAGRYHNKKFKEESEKRGISIEYDKTIGWSITTPTAELKTFIAARGWKKITLGRKGEIKDPKVNKPSSTRKYVCPCCGLSVRATKDVEIACIACSDLENGDIVRMEKDSDTDTENLANAS